MGQCSMFVFGLAHPAFIRRLLRALFFVSSQYIDFFGTRDLFNISYSRELYLFSKFLHFEEIVRVKIAVNFEIIVIEAYTRF